MRSFFTNVARKEWGAPALIAAVAFLLVVAAIDPAGDYPAAPQGPGLTVDETFNVQEGVRLVHGLYGVLLGSLDLQSLFGDDEMLRDQPAPLGYHNPDHPPLGRVWLGVWHQIAATIAPPGDHESPFITVCARTGSAAAFALTVFLVTLVGTRWYGPLAGLIAGIALLLMPRLFGHAHLAALETCIGLTYFAATIAVALFWTRPATPTPASQKQTPAEKQHVPRWQPAALAGAIWGLALLTKIQGVLLIVPVGLWALLHWRAKAILPLVVWGATGLIVFCLGWPWIWYDPLPHFLEYLGRTTDRITLYVWYFGERYADRDVPWHYPWVMFLATVPVGLHLLGIWGLFGGDRPAWKDRREQLLLGAMLFPLVLFSIPGIAVYDGERLFLVSFPLWGMFIGRGAFAAWSWMEQRTSQRAAGTLLTLFVAAQGYGLIACWPAHLSYYNLAVGGLRGADWLGLERNYWGDDLTRGLLEATAQQVPEGARIDVAPVLHQFQLDEMMRQSPILRRRRIQLVAYDEKNTTATRYVLLFRRLADLPDSLRSDEPPGRLLAEVTREGVQLAALYEWPAGGSSTESSPSSTAPSR